jgi:DNA-binding CsgD family transcriptional regulator
MERSEGQAGSLATVISAILEAATDSRRWEAVLACLRQQLNAVGIALADFDFASRTGSISHCVGYNPRHVRLYRERYSVHNIWLQPGKWYLPGRVTFGEEIVTADQLVATDFYRKWLEPQDFYHRLCGVISREGERVVYVETMRAQYQDDYTAAERRLVESLLPYLIHALRCNNYLWRLAITQDMLDHVSYAALAVDSERRLLFANELAQEELSKQQGLAVRSGELCALAPSNNAKLKSLIRDAATATNGRDDHAGGALVIRRGGRLLPIWLVAMPMGRYLRKVVGQENDVALIFVSTPECLGRILETTLRKVYGLTPKERKLIKLIFKGYPVSEAATELSISINTARTHMKRIYRKTKTERQTDLVRLLLTGPVCQLDMQRV